jgi:hypothetical protein
MMAAFSNMLFRCSHLRGSVSTPPAESINRPP